ncbi:MAG: hypothetical protein KJ592_04500 [Nanoarchaeota archaeon]|nr:hypothetical protein [Nanoarchaeota archaeon]
MKLHIDISGQVQQKNLNSALGCKRDDGAEKSVFLKSKIKKDVLLKHKGQVTNLIEKIHCILIYYCVRDFLDGIDEIIICKDVDFRKLKNLLLLLMGDKLAGINIVQRKSNSEKSFAHNVALKTKRNKKHAQLNVTRRMIEDILIKI